MTLGLYMIWCMGRGVFKVMGDHFVECSFWFFSYRYVSKIGEKKTIFAKSNNFSGFKAIFVNKGGKRG